MVFSKKLKELRLSRKWSQTDLCEKIGVRQSMITQYENGSSVPSVEMLITIAEVFDVSIDYLVGASKNKANFESNESDLVRITNLIRPKIKGVPVTDSQWKMINNFLQTVVEQLEEEGKLPRG